MWKPAKLKRTLSRSFPQLSEDKNAHASQKFDKSKDHDYLLGFIYRRFLNDCLSCLLRQGGLRHLRYVQSLHSSLSMFRATSPVHMCKDRWYWPAHRPYGNHSLIIVSVAEQSSLSTHVFHTSPTVLRTISPRWLRVASSLSFYPFRSSHHSGHRFPPWPHAMATGEQIEACINTWRRT
jgi:hypothetical protein